MAKDGKVAGIVLGIGAAITGIIVLVTKAKAAPPPPPPGLANLYGKVTDALTGKKIPGVLVTLNGMQTDTDSAGNYIFADLEPGGYTLTFQKEGYETAVY